MKSFGEIKAIRRCIWEKEEVDGFNGYIYLPHWSGTVIVSNGAGWEHVSVSPNRKSLVPSWDDMCLIKDLFWNEDEAVIQVHPPKEEYVNNLSNCLHLFRCSYKEMVLPPSILVGVRKGQTIGEIEAEIKEAYLLAGENYET